MIEPSRAGPVCQSVSQSVCQSVGLSVCLSINRSICLSDWLVYLPSMSTLLIIICRSSSRGFSPRERMAFPNSLVVMKPLLSLSKC